MPMPYAPNQVKKVSNKLELACVSTKNLKKYKKIIILISQTIQHKEIIEAAENITITVSKNQNPLEPKNNKPDYQYAEPTKNIPTMTNSSMPPTSKNI